jgi:hypothetical protein
LKILFRHAMQHHTLTNGWSDKKISKNMSLLTRTKLLLGGSYFFNQTIINTHAFFFLISQSIIYQKKRQAPLSTQGKRKAPQAYKGNPKHPCFFFFWITILFLLEKQEASIIQDLYKRFTKRIHAKLSKSIKSKRVKLDASKSRHPPRH